MNEDHDTNVKLMEWSERKFQGKVNEKISNDMELSQVDLAKNLESKNCTLEHILSLQQVL